MIYLIIFKQEKLKDVKIEKYFQLHIYFGLNGNTNLSGINSKKKLKGILKSADYAT